MRQYTAPKCGIVSIVFAHQKFVKLARNIIISQFLLKIDELL